MEYTRLGSTGLEVSRLCFGTWRFGKESGGTVETNREQAHELLDACWDRGINFVDTANSYGDDPGTSERWIGEWLDEHDREDVVLASKVYNGVASRFTNNLSRKNIRAEIEGSLDRLGTDYLDLYYIHRWDDGTPIRETLRTLHALVEEGKVHYLGASSMAAWQLTKALWQSDVDGLDRFEVTQPRYNAAYREEVSDFVDVCADQGLAVCPYSPLDGGFLTGKYDRDGSLPDSSRAALREWDDRWSDRQWRTLEAIRSVAEDADATPAQVSLRWLLDRDRFTCVPIVGARTVDQLEENAAATELSLSAGQRGTITDAYAIQE